MYFDGASGEVTRAVDAVLGKEESRGRLDGTLPGSKYHGMLWIASLLLYTMYVCSRDALGMPSILRNPGRIHSSAWRRQSSQGEQGRID